MKERILKLNKHIQRVFGEVLLEEADLPTDVMVTISRVETVPNLRSSSVWLYVYPFNRGEEVIDYLTPQLYDLQGSFNRKLHLRPLPRIILKLDKGSEHAERIEKKLATIRQEEKEQTPGDSSGDSGSN